MLEKWTDTKESPSIHFAWLGMCSYGVSTHEQLWTWVDLANTKGWAWHDLTEMEEINLEKVFTS